MKIDKRRTACNYKTELGLLIIILLVPNTLASLEYVYMGFPGGSDGKESACKCRKPGFDPWVGKIPWRRQWLPTPYSCLENSMDRGARQAMSMGSQRVRYDWTTNTHTHTHIYTQTHISPWKLNDVFIVYTKGMEVGISLLLWGRIVYPWHGLEFVDVWSSFYGEPVLADIVYISFL